MTKWQDESWCKGVRFGFKLNYWLDRLGDILIGVSIGLLIMLWVVYS